LKALNVGKCQNIKSTEEAHKPAFCFRENIFKRLLLSVDTFASHTPQCWLHDY